MTGRVELLDRITVRADVFRDKPVIRDMRIAVEHILGMLATGGPCGDRSPGIPGPSTWKIFARVFCSPTVSLAGGNARDRVLVREAS